MSLAKYVQEPSFFCNALSVSSPKEVDLKISFLVCFQFYEISPLGGLRNPSST